MTSREQYFRDEIKLMAEYIADAEAKLESGDYNFNSRQALLDDIHRWVQRREWMKKQLDIQ